MADHPNAEALYAMRHVYAALFAASARDVTDELGLDRLSISNVCVTVSEHPWGGGEVQVFYQAPERDTGAFHRFSRCVPFRGVGRATPREIAERVRWAVVSTALHEVDEVITVNGERPFDPHKPVSRWRLPQIERRTWMLLAVGWALGAALQKLLGWADPSWWEMGAPIALVLIVLAFAGIVSGLRWAWGLSDWPAVLERPCVVMARAGAVGVDAEGRLVDA